MPATRLLPLSERPILRVDPAGGGERFLVVADLHLGLGAVEGWAEGPPEAAPMAMADELLRATEETRSRRIIFAGDVKHPIVGTPRPLRPVVFDFFSELLRAGVAVDVVLGNHDVGLEPALPKEVRVHPSGGLVRAGIGIFHGHRWPSARLLAQPRLVAGHLHPGFRFAPSADDAGAKRRCWVRTRFPPRPPKVGRRRRRRFAATELVVLPAFHPLAGTEALNRSRPSRGRSFLFARFLAVGESRLYLMDGTDLGPLTVPPRPVRPKARAAAPPDR